MHRNVVSGVFFNRNTYIDIRVATRGAPLTKVVQGWPKFWTNFRVLVGAFSQSVGPSLAIYATLTWASLPTRWQRMPALRRVKGSGGSKRW